jgi:hypothetical protein
MQNERRPEGEERDDRGDAPRRGEEPPETARHPVPGVEHLPEPDAENIMPAEHEPGTL